MTKYYIVRLCVFSLSATKKNDFNQNMWVLRELGHGHS